MRVIRPSQGLSNICIDLAEIWRRRELISMLLARDIKVRYRRSLFGPGWVILQPVLLAAVISLAFGRLTGAPSEGAPYPAFALAGVLCWQTFARASTQASLSLVQNEQIVKKVYVPRLIFPLVSVLGAAVDFSVSLVIVLPLVFYLGIEPKWTILMSPLFVALALCTALGIGLWLAAIDVRFRDVRHALPFLVQLLFFASPVIYPTSLLPERWSVLYGLNPMASVVEAFRWSIIGTSPPSTGMFVVSMVVIVVLVITGWAVFRVSERTLVDQL